MFETEFLVAVSALSGLNLKLVLQPTSDGQYWGKEEPPGSGNFTGLILSESLLLSNIRNKIILTYVYQVIHIKTLKFCL